MTSLAMQHLEKANEIRIARADWKRRIADGQGNVRATIFEPPRYMQTASLLETLTAVHRVGDRVARKTCGRANVNPLLTLRELTTGQRNRVLRAMESVRMFAR